MEIWDEGIRWSSEVRPTGQIERTPLYDVRYWEGREE